ncbi:MAG: hypothetical protein RMM17_03050 [Acidobacteriota bacterium]|nr:hypothetical protein [Blastocatellia bacterium]MDW8411646.1 hypothetical protein [Acidobacteriota bacterium]
MSEKFQAFKAGDWQYMRQAPQQQQQTDEVVFERHYPVFEKYLQRENFGAIFRKCENSCIEFDRVVRSGTRQDAEDAQKILNAYGRAMQLAAELLEVKAKLKSS